MPHGLAEGSPSEHDAFVSEVLWRDRRRDVIEALCVLADVDSHQCRLRNEATWPGLTEAVHWLIDDTWLDQQPASTLIPEMFVDQVEADSIDRVVAALMAVLEALGPIEDDSRYVLHPGWPAVVEASDVALSKLAR